MPERCRREQTRRGLAGFVSLPAFRRSSRSRSGARRSGETRHFGGKIWGEGRSWRCGGEAGQQHSPALLLFPGLLPLTAARRARLSPGPAEERNELLLLLRLSPRESNPGLCSPPGWCPHHPSALPDLPAWFLPHLLICSVPFPARSPGLPLHSLSPIPTPEPGEPPAPFPAHPDSCASPQSLCQPRPYGRLLFATQE